MDSYILADFSGFLANHGWLLIWIVFVLTFFISVHEHADLSETIKNSGGTEQAAARRKRALLWTLSAVSLLAAIGSQVGAEKTDNNIADLRNDLSNAVTNAGSLSNQLTVAVEQIAKQSNALAAAHIEPLDARLRKFLDRLDPRILAGLKIGRTNVHGMILETQKRELENMAAESGADQFIIMRPVPENEKSFAIDLDGSRVSCSFTLSRNLIKTP